MRLKRFGLFPVPLAVLERIAPERCSGAEGKGNG